MAKMAGENSPTLTGAGAEATLPFVTMTLPWRYPIRHQVPRHDGVNLVGLQEQQRRIDELVLPLTNFTVTPPSVVESGIVSAPAGAAARMVPKIENSEPGAMACPGTKLAPFTIPPTVG